MDAATTPRRDEPRETTEEERTELVLKNMDIVDSIALIVARRLIVHNRREMIGYVYEQLVLAAKRWDGRGSFRNYACNRIPLWVVGQIRDMDGLRAKSRQAVQVHPFSAIRSKWQFSPSHAIEQAASGLRVVDKDDGTTWGEKIAAKLGDRSGAGIRGVYLHHLTLKQIGERIGLSESRVSQMHTAILADLRERLTFAEAAS